MLIRNATQNQIEQALAKANESFNGNLQFNRFEFAGRTRQGTPKFNVTLRVAESHGKGARLGFPDYQTGKQRHLINACWHAHGTFFDALPEDAEIVTSNTVTYPGATWVDRNIGSMMRPLYYSEACEC